MKSQKRATGKPEPKRGGQPHLLSRVRPLTSALQSASRVRATNLSLSQFPKRPQQQPRYFEAPQQRARTFSMPVKLREPPKPPVEIIQIPPIPSIPSIPSGITFEMLANLYSDELLLSEIKNLEEDAEEIAMNIIEQDNFDETILRMIRECKEKVRLMLWNKFYTTLSGDAKTMSGGNGDDYDAWYGDDAKTEKTAKTAKTEKKPIIAKWRFRLSVFRFVSRVLKFCIEFLSKYITEDPPPSARQRGRQYYMDRMESIRVKTLEDLRTSGLNITQLESIRANFFSVPEDKAKLSLQERDRLESLPISKLYTTFPPDIRNSGVYNRLYQPFVGVKHLKLHGMSLPYQFDRTELLRNMLYLIERFDIKKFVDLHDCEGITNTSGCNPYDLSVGRDMFDLAVKVMKRGGREYINVKGYVDMRSGSYSAWHEISKIPDTSVYETLVHCYMGRGRTGSVLLFLLLRDCKNIHTYFNLLHKPHLGYVDIFELRKALVALFDDNDIVADVAGELFNLIDMKRIRLLRQRLNRIFFFLAKKHKVSHVCLYRDIPPYPLIIEEIKRRLKRENPTWRERKIELESYEAYRNYPSDVDIISSEFSKTTIYEMSVIEEMKDSGIEKILNGYDISTRHSGVRRSM